MAEKKSALRYHVNFSEEVKSTLVSANSGRHNVSRTVLLIGPSGSGKSTLGNFLFNTKEDVFEVSRANTPTTRSVVTESAEMYDIFSCPKYHLSVIDTPGLNQECYKDLQNMIDLIKQLEHVKEIGACILVVRFSYQIDAQYKAMIKYYSKLLPSLFEKNIIIVMTEFSTHEMAVKMRDEQRLDVELIKRNTVNEIVKCANLIYRPILYTIDCIPIDNEAIGVSLLTRNSILQHLLTLQPVNVSDLPVAKTQFLLNKDREQVKRYELESIRYIDKMKRVESWAVNALSEYKKLEDEVNRLSREVTALQCEHDDMNTLDLITIDSWSVEREWKFFRWSEANYDLKSCYPIENVRRSSSGLVTWKDEILEDNTRLKGTISGRFMRGFNASITIETQKKMRYRTEIEEIERRLETKRENLEHAKEECKKCRDRHTDFSKEIKQLEKHIEENEDNVKTLSMPTMSINEALTRLNELLHHK